MKQDDLIPQFIMLIGVPGSGKSTYIQKLKNEKPNKNYVILSTDDILTDWANDEGISYQDAFSKYIKDATKEFNRRFRQAISTNSDIIIDRTNLTSGGRAKLLNQVPSFYQKIAIVFNVDRNELKRRLDQREIETGKHIPDHVVDNMIKNYQPPTNKEFDVIKYV